MVTAQSSPNIALIKYWGNRNDDLRLPAAPSLSMTLDTPTVNITVDHCEYLALESTKDVTPTDISRFEVTLRNIKRYLIEQGLETALPGSLSIHVDSQIPPGIGLASSSAVFSALAKAIAQLIDATLTDEQISILARLGSGSASRSIFGGFVAMENVGEGIAGAVAAQIAPEDHWQLYDIIIAPSGGHKKVGSTEGHRGAHTSPGFDARVREITERRQQECTDAILQKDFEKLQKVSEEDCMDMHHCMQTQNPPLQYLNKETYRIIDEITALREAEHLPVLYTMDAGPTVHLVCEQEAVETIKKYAHKQRGCAVFEAQIGQGAKIIKG